MSIIGGDYCWKEMKQAKKLIITQIGIQDSIILTIFAASKVYETDQVECTGFDFHLNQSYAFDQNDWTYPKLDYVPDDFP